MSEVAMRTLLLLLLVLVPLRTPVVPEPVPPVPPVDLSGQWLHVVPGVKRPTAYTITHKYGAIGMDDVNSGAWSAVGCFDGRLLKLTWFFVPSDGNYRYIAQLELKDGELVGHWAQSDECWFDNAGVMHAHDGTYLSRMTLRRVRPPKE